MRTVETTGKSIEDAKRRAASELGVAIDDIEFEVLDVGAKGMFGFLGGSPARVRATYYESRRHHREAPVRTEGAPAPEPSGRSGRQRSDRGRGSGPRQPRRPEDAQRRDRGPARSEQEQGDRPPRASGQRRQSTRNTDSQQPQAGSERPPRQRSQERRDGAPPRERQERPERTERPDAPERAERQERPAASGRGGGQGRSGRQGGSRQGRTRQPAEPAGVAAEAGSQAGQKPQAAGKAGAQQLGVDQAAEKAVDIVQRIVDAGNLEGKVTLGETVADGFEVEIEGGETDILASNGGQALDALQFIIGIIVNRNQESKMRITLEAGGLRRKHREMLEQTAMELAAQVVEHQQEAELEPLPARDRRIIHNILKDHPEVMTYSEGEGDNRRVIISPREAAASEG